MASIINGEATNAWVLLKDPRNFSKVNSALKEAGFTDIVYFNGYMEFKYPLSEYDADNMHEQLRKTIPEIYDGIIEFSDGDEKWSFAYVEYAMKDANKGSGEWVEYNASGIANCVIKQNRNLEQEAS